MSDYKTTVGNTKPVKPPTQTVNHDGSTTTTYYDSDGKVTGTSTSVVNQDGSSTETRKDAAGNPTDIFTRAVANGPITSQVTANSDGTTDHTDFTADGSSKTVTLASDGKTPVATAAHDGATGADTTTYVNPDGTPKGAPTTKTVDQQRADAQANWSTAVNADAQDPNNPELSKNNPNGGLGNWLLNPRAFVNDTKAAAGDVKGYVDSFNPVGTPGVGGTSGSGGDLPGAVDKVANEAFGYADKNRAFELGGLDTANAALDPAKQSYAALYGPGGTLAGPGQGETAFDAQGGHLIDPTAQSKALGAASPFLSGQSPGMGAYQDVAGKLSGPTLSGQGYADFSGQLGQKSAGEQRYDATSGKYDTNALSQAAPGLNAKLDAPTNLQNNLGSIAGGYASPTASQSTFNAQRGQLGGPGGLEQFAASDLAGTNPYYNQLQAQQSADIDASMNARGGFNSGAAIKAQALGASNLRAQQYQQEGQLQGAAQTAQMSRLGQQQSAAGASDTARFQGLSGQQGALSAADAQRLAATQSQIGLAGTQASTDLGYLAGGQSAANAAGAAGLARTQTGIGLAQSADATNLAQNMGYMNAANSAGAGQVSQYNALGNMAQGADAASQASYMNYLSSAAGAQNAAQSRQQQGFADAAGLGATQAGQTITAYGKAGDEYASMVGAGMGAQLNAAQLAAQQAQNDKANQLGYAGLLTKIITG